MELFTVNYLSNSFLINRLLFQNQVNRSLSNRVSKEECKPRQKKRCIYSLLKGIAFAVLFLQVSSCLATFEIESLSYLLQFLVFIRQLLCPSCIYHSLSSAYILAALLHGMASLTIHSLTHRRSTYLFPCKPAMICSLSYSRYTPGH
jgi:hypothetical protein